MYVKHFLRFLREVGRRNKTVFFRTEEYMHMLIYVCGGYYMSKQTFYLPIRTFIALKFQLLCPHKLQFYLECVNCLCTFLIWYGTNEYC